MKEALSLQQLFLDTVEWINEMLQQLFLEYSGEIDAETAVPRTGW